MWLRRQGMRCAAHLSPLCVPRIARLRTCGVALSMNSCAN
jgi:hypothetical protein